MHPSVVLFKESNIAVALPIGDHYAGSKNYAQAAARIPF